ncbi:hypothetical protein AJ79_08941 [Helicocarpus griseus UAMH5409]|uniref:Zn(2)-C6 fungal-type domain-containing protein n=1 Tax=Helicocarpus griseus UAMH5409 TaxID=1447875 RepID=A0A2B7WNN2_9EURO|nr:hypothetical protein AJ79_08941 [Helicocarpus griseus UAMH5409]
MPTRRPHQKSRHGCVACKRRRIKCDELRPQCTSCRNRAVECQYISTGNLMWLTERSSPSSSCPTPDTTTGTQPTDATNESLDMFGRLFGNGASLSIPMPVPDPNLQDLELMMNWCNFGLRSFPIEPEYERVWKVVLPRESLAHPFLMHGILALSALDLARRRDDNAVDVHQRRYLSIALAHQSRALALFRPLLGNINPENCNAMFLLSTLMTVFAFGFPQTSDPVNIGGPIEDLHLVILLSRGMQQVLSTSMHWIKNGELSAIVELEDYVPHIPDDAKLALQELRRLNEDCGRNDPQHALEKDVYNDAIDLVQFILEKIHSGAKRANSAVMWAIKAPPRYLELMRQYKPMALVVLAHYCVILHHLRDIWWIEGWSVSVLRAVWSSLDDNWRQSLRWAIDVTGFTPQ